MNILLVYESVYGNTARIAQAISDTLAGQANVRLAHVDQAAGAEFSGLDLLVLGAPTQRRRVPEAMEGWLDRVPEDSLRDLAVATFDTRRRLPILLSGSAARQMAQSLQRLGARLVAPPESFFVVGREGPLLEGEAERAAGWARTLIGGYRARLA